MAKRDYYEALGIDRNANGADIKKAYRKMARQYHPDINQEAGAEERFKEINEAHDVLSDDQKRAAYDRFGHAAFDGTGGMGGAGAGGFDFDFGDIFDIFNNFAGGGGNQRRRRNGPRKGSDLRYDLTLDFEEAIFGVEKTVDVTRPEQCDTCTGSGAQPGTDSSRCKHCNGAGEVRKVQQSILGSFVNVSTCPVCEGAGEVIETPCTTCSGRKYVQKTRNLSVKVPAGVDADTQIRLTNEGGPGANGGPAGNLYVFIDVKPHAYFKRQGNDIVLDLEVNVAQATLGDEVMVPTVDGEEPLKIPAGTPSGKVMRLRNKGVPYLRSSGRGDQLVVVNVTIPTKLTEEQKRLFQELSKTLSKDPVIPQTEKGFFESMRDALFK